MIATYHLVCEKLGCLHGADPWRDCGLRLRTKDIAGRHARTPTTTLRVGHSGFFNFSTC
jgi:hypothetical protein